MKSITEFAKVALANGLAKKTALEAEGKSAEEAQIALGEAMKMEGDKLKHFIAAIGLAKDNETNLKRILVVSLNEGEAAPAKAIKIDEHYYIPEFHVEVKFQARHKPEPKGGGKGKGRGGRGDRGGKPKESPWGKSPEERAAKGAANTAPSKK